MSDSPTPTGAPRTADLPPPPQQMVDVLLADGSTASVRPATSADREALVAFHEGLSTRSTTLRYFGVHPRLTESDLSRMTGGTADHVVLLALRNEKVMAVAEYHRTAGSDEAEVAFVVDDAFQGHGVGTILLEHLASAARRQGVRRFVADTLGENDRMLEVFAKAGFARTSEFDSGIVRVVLQIEPSLESVARTEARDRHAVVQSMTRLLRPQSVAVIGASRRPGSIGYELVRNLVQGGFCGPVYPVNPSATAVASLPCWPSVAEVPGPVELAVVAVPAADVADVVAQCGAKGVGALVLISSGFAEVGPEGAAEQRRVVALAHQWGMRVVGPNCFGVLNTEPSVQMNATFARDWPDRGRVGFASQSGGLGIAILAEAGARGLGLSTFVSMGNKADVSGNDLLAWWDEDPETDVVLLYLESFGNPRKFSRLARQVGRHKPIVAVKAGRSASGRAAATSHTAAMASSDRAVEALFHQCGVVRVDTVEELFDVAELLIHQPVPAGPRVGIITNAGGPGILAADAASRNGLVVPALSDDCASALQAGVPNAANVRNPVDLAAGAGGEEFRHAVEVLLRSGEVDGLVVVFTPPITTRGDAVAAGIVAGTEAVDGAARAIPVVATFLGEPEGRTTLAAAPRPVPCYTYPETAVRAVGHAVTYGRWRQVPEEPLPVLRGVDANRARRLAIARDGRAWLTGADAMGVLDSFGIATAVTLGVADADGAAHAAQEVGLPCALKATGPGLLHKTEHGGVRLMLDSADAVATAYREMAEHLGHAMTGAVVQPMAAPGVEVIVGMHQDPQMGPVVLVGLGGTTAELLDDHREGLAPLTATEAREMVLGLRGAPLLTGYRGARPVDVDALVDTVLRMSRLADDLPEVAEVDCNPVIATPDGVVVVDARIRIDDHRPPPDDRRRL